MSNAMPRSYSPTPTHQAKVVCPEPLAATAGGRIIEQGGNAVDAAIAAAFAQGVVNPLMCGVGGTANVMIYHRDDQQVSVIEGRGGAGSKARQDSYRYIAPSVYSNRYVVENQENYLGYKASTIPTFVRVLADTHARYGQLPWSSLLQPAIEYAANGFQIDSYVFQTWDPEPERFSDSPPPLVQLNTTAECARIYLNKGQVYQIGETLRQIDYAHTLQRIAEQGADVFYRGEIGRAIANDFEAHGGLITQQDLDQCYTRFLRPVIGTYRDYVVATSGPPGMGQSQIQALNILENLDLSKLMWGSAQYYDTLVRVFQTIYADRIRYNGDPLYQEVDLEKFLSKERARELAQALTREPGELASQIEGGTPAESNTTHVSVVDTWGNAATITHSNGASSGVVTPGLGFLYNNHMHNFDVRPGHRNSIEPGKKGQYGCPPIMMFRQGQLHLISGSKSRFKVTADLQVTVSILDYGVDVQQAVEQPRIHAEYAPSTIYAEPTVEPSLLQNLKAFGWELKIIRMNAPLCMIVRAEDGHLQVANDPRGGGGIWQS